MKIVLYHQKDFPFFKCWIWKEEEILEIILEEAFGIRYHRRLSGIKSVDKMINGCVLKMIRKHFVENYKRKTKWVGRALIEAPWINDWPSRWRIWWEVKTRVSSDIRKNVFNRLLRKSIVVRTHRVRNCPRIEGNGRLHQTNQSTDEKRRTKTKHLKGVYSWKENAVNLHTWNFYTFLHYFLNMKNNFWNILYCSSWRRRLSSNNTNRSS